MKSVTIGVLATAWVVVLSLIVRQRYLLQAVDPHSDTGVSFGYVFLLGFVTPALLGISILVACVFAWKSRRSRRILSSRIFVIEKV